MFDSQRLAPSPRSMLQPSGGSSTPTTPSAPPPYRFARSSTGAHAPAVSGGGGGGSGCLRHASAEPSEPPLSSVPPFLRASEAAHTSSCSAEAGTLTRVTRHLPVRTRAQLEHMSILRGKLQARAMHACTRGPSASRLLSASIGFYRLHLGGAPAMRTCLMRDAPRARSHRASAPRLPSKRRGTPPH